MISLGMLSLREFRSSSASILQSFLLRPLGFILLEEGRVRFTWRLTVNFSFYDSFVEQLVLLLSVNLCSSCDNVLGSLHIAASMFCNMSCCSIMLNMCCFILHARSGMQLYWTSKFDMKLSFDHLLLCLFGSKLPVCPIELC